MNENIQGVIPLTGVGHTHRQRGNYQPGEFRDLVNCEILDEGIVNRRRITAVTTADDVLVDKQVNMDSIIGYYQDSVITSNLYSNSSSHANGNHKQWRLDGTSDECFQPMFLQVSISGGTDNWAKVVAYYYYNETHYWINHRYSKYGIGPDHQTELEVVYNNTRKEPHQVDIADLTKSTIVQTNVLVNDKEYTTYYKGSFIHKDRLWVYTNRKLYFSKATDFSVWAVPDGGFFSFMEGNINKVIALKDSIYVVSDNSVSVLTYTDDPNTDATVRVVSDNIGGDSAAVVGDTPYFIKDNYLYSITNNYITKVLEVNTRHGWQGSAKWRLWSFGHYLVATYSKLCVLHAADPLNNVVDLDLYDSSQWFSYYGHHWVSYNTIQYAGNSEAGENLDTIFINTENGSIHAIDYFNVGAIADMMFVPIENSSDNRQYLWFLSKSLYASDNTKIVGHLSVMPLEITSTESPFNAIDMVSQIGGANIYKVMPMYVEVDSYTPDGSEFFMKKFRNLLVEGEFFDGCVVEFAFDNGPYGEDFVIEVADLVSPYDLRNPTPIRIPINQRARSMSLRFRNKFANQDYVNNPTRFSLTRLMTLWSYTGRGPVTRHVKSSDVSV